MLNISKEEFYRRLCDILKSRGVDAADRRNFRYFIQFVARAPGGECMVKIYQGKKGTHAQILNDVGDGGSVVRGAIEEMTGVLPFSAGEGAKASAPDGHAITAPLVGTDESGKGDFFGPLVVAAVYVTPEGAAELAAAGVRDCKTMTDRAVLTRAGHIERSTVNAVVTVKPERYNSLYGEMGNLNRMLAWCHARAIENILEKVKCDYVLTDQFGDRSLVERALMDKGRRVTLEQRPRAEANIAVAAASVLARAKFVESLREMSDEYGTTLPKGASAKVDAAARDFVRAFGRAELHKVAKMHFRNAKKL
ncbi:MAG: ribonuclease HIII [Planctomycetota bacterium]|nr:MAG: ribonuclease HIII [Planctomycetota bacterium]